MAHAIKRTDPKVIHLRVKPQIWDVNDWLVVSNGTPALLLAVEALLLANVPVKYWKILAADAGVEEMSQLEKNAVDAIESAVDDEILETHSLSNLLSRNEEKNTQEFFDDFFGGYNPNIWTKSGLGTVVAFSPGVLRFTAPAVSGNENARLITTAMKVQVVGFQDLSFRLAEETISSQVVVVGLYEDANNFLAFRRTNGGNWMAFARKAGVITSVDTGVAGVQGVFRVFQFARDGGSALFRINGKTVATIDSSNAPTSSVLEFIIDIASTSIGSDRMMDLDTVRLWVDRA